MKALLLLALIVVSLGERFEYDLTLPTPILFNQFLARENFVLGEDGQARYQVFSDNVDRIKVLNNVQKSAKFGLNKFALLTEEEFAQQYLTLKTPFRDVSMPVAEEYPQSVVAALPDTWDWREKGAVTAVKDQGQCGSCWTFSTTGNIEGQWFLAGHSLVSLSEQNIVDCDHLCVNGTCDDGCNGGLMGTAFQFVMQQGGVDTEASYPYTAEGATCQFNRANIGASINGWNMVSSDEGQMAAYLVANGPLSVAVDANSWQFYMGGVLYNPVPCGTSLDHGVLVVGYGTETDIMGQTMPYWTIKNSWGSGWGDNGYIYIERGDGYCGVNLYACSSWIKKPSAF